MFHSDEMPCGGDFKNRHSEKAELIGVTQKALEIFSTMPNIDPGDPQRFAPDDRSLESQVNRYLLESNKAMRGRGVGVFYARPFGLFSWGAKFEYLTGRDLENEAGHPFFFEIFIANPLGDGLRTDEKEIVRAFFLARYENPLFRCADPLTFCILREKEFLFAPQESGDLYYVPLRLYKKDNFNPKAIAEAAYEIVEDLREAFVGPERRTFQEDSPVTADTGDIEEEYDDDDDEEEQEEHIGRSTGRGVSSKPVSPRKNDSGPYSLS